MECDLAVANSSTIECWALSARQPFSSAVIGPKFCISAEQFNFDGVDDVER